ncbi:S-adenosyl-L-methionine-dependent methyltransferase, partial [Trichodelitschia bisporula]
LSLYGASYYRVLTQPCPTPPSDINLNAIYNATAGGFDAKVDSAEYWSGLMRLRARLVRQAKGDVLEAAAGTGRNSEFYDSRRVRRLVLVDRSAGMLGIAREKWEGQQGAAEWGGGRVRFLVGDVAAGGVEDVLREGGEGYDTVVQTNGLCSVEDPVAMLRNLGRLVRRDGRVLLLEHGRSYYEWVNRLMDKTAAQHAASHGCWWNRDVEGIVKESGLEVVKMKRSHLGTHYWVELK